MPDTSFTLHSALAKARQANPAISLAQPARPADVWMRRNVVYSQPNGRPLRLDVYYPQARRRGGYPAVLLIHGGGWRSGNRAMHTAMAEQLAGQGFVAAVADYRLSDQASYPAAVVDLQAALRWLRTHARTCHANPQQLVAWGFSAGGQLAALLGTTGDTTLFAAPAGTAAVQAVVDVDGILAFLHPESGEGDDRKGISAATAWFGYSKAERPALWQQASALTHVGPHTPPILFINSSVARMHAGRDDLAAQLKAHGIYYEIHTFPDAPHPFVLFNPWFEPTLRLTVQFLRRVFPQP